MYYIWQCYKQWLVCILIKVNDVWNWGHLLHNKKISGLSFEFKSGKKNKKNTYKFFKEFIEAHVRTKAEAHASYYNKRDLVQSLKEFTIDGFEYIDDPLVHCVPIPYRFAETKTGKPFQTGKDINHLHAWWKYRTENGNIGPIIVWGSAKGTPIIEEFYMG